MKQTFTERQRNIISYLLKGPATTEKLAHSLGVNRRTVLRELPQLSEKLEAFGVKLERRAGAGLRIWGEEHALSNLEQEMKNAPDSSKLTPEERRHLILLSLLEQKQPVKLYAFARRFNVTEATISYDLDKIEEELWDYDIRLIRRPGLGIKLEGAESSLRRLILDLFYKNFQEEHLLRILKDNVSGGEMLKNDTPPTGAKVIPWEYVLKFIDGRMVMQIEKILDEVLKSSNFPLADSSYAGLLVHIALAMDRLKDKDAITMDKGLLLNLKKTREFKLAREIARSLEKHFELTIPEEEMGYITMHLLGAKLRIDGGLDEFFMIDHREATEAAHRILKQAGEELKVDLLKDRRILEGLAVHLKPAISRLKLGMEIRNPLLSQLKQNYPEIMQVARKAGKTLGDIFHVRVPESEIGYIAMHIGAALENKTERHSIKALLVCASGIGSARMLASRVQKELPELVVQNVVSLGEAKQTLEKYPFVDMVLSTVPLELDRIPVLRVSPLLTESEIMRIKEFLKSKDLANSYEKTVPPGENTKHPVRDIPENKFNGASAVFELLEDFMLVQDLEVENTALLVKKIAAHIGSRVEVISPEKIAEDLLARQNVAGCGVPGERLAVLHARSSGVKKPFLGVFRLKKSIAMETMDGKTEEVDVALVMLLPSSPLPEEREIMGTISAAIIEDPDLPGLFLKGSGEEIIKALIKVFKK